MLIDLEGWKNLGKTDLERKYAPKLKSIKKELFKKNKDFTFLRNDNNRYLQKSIKTRQGFRDVCKFF